MDIRINIYDFFARTVPGVCYLLIIAGTCDLFGWVDFDFSFADYSLAIIFVWVVGAYVAGYVMDPIAVQIWYNRFRQSNLPEVAYQDFRRRNPNLQPTFSSEDWRILRAYIKLRNNAELQDVEINNVRQILLRNIGFAFVLCTIILIVYSILFSQIVSGGIALFFLILSIVATRQALLFNRWFYTGIYQLATAYSINPCTFVKIQTALPAPEYKQADEKIADLVDELREMLVQYRQSQQELLAQQKIEHDRLEVLEKKLRKLKNNDCADKCTEFTRVV